MSAQTSKGSVREIRHQIINRARQTAEKTGDSSVAHFTQQRLAGRSGYTSENQKANFAAVADFFEGKGLKGRKTVATLVAQANEIIDARNAPVKAEKSGKKGGKKKGKKNKSSDLFN